MLNLYNRIQGRSLERLAALSDGIFAVAMTLLVLELHIPTAAQVHGERELLVALGALGPQWVAYGMSFLTLGNLLGRPADAAQPHRRRHARPDLDSPRLSVCSHAAAALDAPPRRVHHLSRRTADLLAEHSGPGCDALLELEILDARRPHQRRHAGRGACQHLQADRDCAKSLRRRCRAVRDQHLDQHRSHFARPVELRTRPALAPTKNCPSPLRVRQLVPRTCVITDAGSWTPSPDRGGFWK
jgi:hypothetical protein